MARAFVAITLGLWLALLVFCSEFFQNPGAALLPLYGLYPAAIASGETSYNPTAIYIWMGAMAAVFLALALLGLVWRKPEPAIAFMLLFIFSTIVGYWRVVTSIL